MKSIKSVKIIIIILLSVLCSLSAADFTNVTGIGLGQTEDQALLKAKQDAIEKSVGLLISAKSIVENYVTISDLVVSKANGFVKKYRIVRNENKDGLFEVEIMAEVTDVVDEIIKDQAALNLLINEMGLPAFAVIITDVDGKRDSNSENILVNQLLKKGFKIRNAATKEPDNFKKLADKGIDFVLRGTLTTEFVNMNNIYNINSMKSAQTTLECRIISTTSEEIISAKTVNGKGAYISENTAKVKSLESCVSGLTEYLLTNAIDRWSRETSSINQEVSIIINSITGTKAAYLVKKLDSMFQGGEKMFDKGFADDVQNIVIKSNMNPDQLFELLNKMDNFKNSFEILKKNKEMLAVNLIK